MAERILVIGSNSFSGASFVNFALNKGASVFGVSRSLEPSEIFLPYKKNKDLDRFEFRQIDLNKNLELLLKIIKDFNPQLIVDYAGQGMVAPSWKDPEAWYKTNILAKIKLHEFLRHQKGLELYLRFSTPEVYGGTEDSISERAPMNPSTPYAVSHAAIDMSLMAYFRQYQFPVILTRASNVYGPGQQLYRIIPKTIILAKTGGRLKLDGGGHSVRNFVHIEDVNNALWLLWQKKPLGQVFHIASHFDQDTISVRSLVDKISKKLNLSFSDLVEDVEDRPGKDKAYFLSIKKIEKELGWRSRIHLDDGLVEVLTWATNNLDTIRNLPWDYIHKE